jgi:PAS domain S-box-containing protein
MKISSVLPAGSKPSSDSAQPTLLVIIVMAVAYVVFAKLSYFSTVPPGYASAIWPPTGIALAGVLIYGKRIWPGVWLGSFIVNGLIPELTGSVTELFITLMLTLVISTGATLQAFVGAYWLKRYAGYPSGLKDEKSVLLFLLYGGVLSALINSTLSVAMLVATGKTPLANALNNWLTWWSGDLLGIIIFTPLALAWLLKDTDAWLHRRLAITLPILVMFALTAATVVYEAKFNNEHIRMEFDKQVEELNNALKISLANQAHALHSVKILFLASKEVNRDEFRILTQQLLTDYQEIQSISWAPLIQSLDRDAFEKTIQNKGLPTFQVTELDANQQRVRAKERSYYVPVTFIEPYQTNNKVIGFDNVSNSGRLATLNLATDSGEFTISPRIKLIQDQTQYGVLAVIPLYRNNLPQQTLAEKRLAIASYITGALKLKDLLTSALKYSNTIGLSYRLLDSSAPTDEQLLYTSDESFPDSLVIQEKAWFSDQQTLSSRIAIPFGGRVWTFEIIPNQDYFATHRSGHTWLVMLVGLLLTSLVTLISLIASGRTRWLRQLISESTEELKQEHAQALLLMREKETLSMAIEQSHSSVKITDLDANIVYVNQAFVNSTGYSREEIIGQKSSLLKSNKTPLATYQAMWAALINGNDWQGEFINFTKEGKELHELAWISPIRESDGSIHRYLSVAEDITERKKTNALLVAAKEKAEKLAETKSQFLANMSHEIRTPMNAIIGFSDLALLDELPTETRTYLQDINTASNHLLIILNDILDISKLEAGHMSIIPSPFELKGLLTPIYNLFVKAAQAKGLVLSLDIAENIPDKLVGDTVRLRQVLINLLGNAIKFSQQGEVKLSIALQHLTATEARLLFSVHDTGIGISAAQHDKLFKPFSQVEDGFSRSYDGTGLGLVISQELIQLMGGHINLVSNPGFGSCFSFELLLPLVSLTTVDDSKPSLETEATLLNGIKILVAEDDTFNKKIVNLLLSRYGASVTFADNGLEALAKLEQDTFDVVLMDLHMPAMNGFEATLEIRKQARYAQLPVIALSAGVTDEEKQSCLSVGMNDFVAKPINKVELLATLERWLRPYGG